MLKIGKFSCENTIKGVVTDNPNPLFSFVIETNEGSELIDAKLKVNGWKKDVKDETYCIYDGPSLTPFNKYEAILELLDDKGNSISKALNFETGFLSTSRNGKWISDALYSFKEKKKSPKVMVFKKDLKITKKIKKATLYSTALGIYDVYINNKKIGNKFFAPGFTSYKSQLMYQTYNIREYLDKTDNIVNFIVAGGWAIGSFGISRKCRITAPRQAILVEIHLEFEDGSKEIVVSDESWGVNEDSSFLLADFYDGETFDANIDINKTFFHKVKYEKVSISPILIADYGASVIKHEEFKAKFLGKKNNKVIYDFGQNFAGIINLNIKKACKGQKIEICHAEVLTKNGELNRAFLRTAKAKITYICKEGKQKYSPSFTYMGFRYISVEGIELEDFDITASALYSDIETIGNFECSNEMLNKLQKNIVWSAKSNFIDIPTDCPQRDERMGRTGDISIFSNTACFNFDVSKFLYKWLKDLKSEQIKTGGIPNTIPSQGYGFPLTMPVMAIDFWGDACINVPFALYLKTGNKMYISSMYETMKKYVNACLFWAHFMSFGESRYIWNTLSTFHFGDWVAPDIPKMKQWQKRSKWTATASLKHCSDYLARCAKILGFENDFNHYSKIASKVSKAYMDRFFDKNGKLFNEFQTGYVLPLYFDMVDCKEKEKVAKQLVNLVKKNDYNIGTGFPGTPYILFALADNGYQDVAYKMLLNTKCPSWLYEGKVGATSIWERWDGLNEDGECGVKEDGTGGMISFNHYAAGAIGDFLYRRLAGIEPIKPGYKEFNIQPIIGGDLTYVKAFTKTSFGEISSSRKIINNEFQLEVNVPYRTSCNVIMPSKKIIKLKHGFYKLNELLKEEN